MSEIHPFKKIVKDINADNIPKVCLLFGEEKYLIDWAARSIIDKTVNENFKVFDFIKLDAEKSDIHELEAACETMPMASRKRIVLIEGYKSAKRKAAGDNEACGKENESDKGGMEKYMKDIPQTCLLVIKADYVNKTSSLYKYVKKIGGDYDFSKLDSGTLTDFIKKEFKQNGKQAEQKAINRLIDMSGYFNRESEYGLYDFQNEIKKISDYTDSGIINESHVEDVIIPTLDDDVFSMLDAITSGKVNKAFSILNVILQEKNKEFMIMATIASHFDSALMMAEMFERGYDMKEIASYLKVHPFRVQKMSKMAREIPVKKLRKLLKKALMMEALVKSGEMEAKLSLETFLISIKYE